MGLVSLSSSEKWAGSGTAIRRTRLPGCLPGTVIWGALLNLSVPQCSHLAKDERSTYLLVRGKKRNELINVKCLASHLTQASPQ